MEERPTRWHKARQDWRGFGLRRDAARGAVGAVAGIFALLALGFPGAAVENVIYVLAAGLVGGVALPLAQLGWCWLQAPMRMLSDDMRLVLGRIEKFEASASSREKATPRRVDVRLSLVAQISKGGEISPLYAYGGGTDRWTGSIVDLLAAHGKAGDAERFLRATEATGPQALAERLDFLRELVEEYE